ncbi:MAG: M20/M25/M40 family metallo-hydrolase [Ruminococcus bromii]|nr:M20/M25/M40 family metallo-hydrolase [Ruminococcus bromii]MDY4710774.1 M20/M25/M40 family metallo-hydrolase [Ruminococcus bromii]
MDIKNLIFELCSSGGVSGSEEPAIEIANKYLNNFAEVSTDRNGNLYAVLGNKDADKTILLDAHIDRIGFMVTDINSNGFVKVDKCGGIDVRVLQDSELVLQKNNNITGIVCCLPPHLSDGKEDKATPISKTWVDFGMPYDEVKKHIKIGDVLTYHSVSKELLNGRIAAPALDNRCSVAALIRCAEILSDYDNLKYKVVVLFSSQEETFGTGAKTGAYKTDADEAISVDVSFASQPDISGQYSKIELAKGPMICISPILNREMSDKLISIASDNKIPYQTEPISGLTGTNADHISVTKGGVKTSVVSIPQRYMHTTNEVIDIEDVENTSKLIAEYIKCGGAFDD